MRGPAGVQRHTGAGRDAAMRRLMCQHILGCRRIIRVGRGLAHASTASGQTSGTAGMASAPRRGGEMQRRVEMRADMLAMGDAQV